MRFHTMSPNGALSERIGSHRAAWVRMRALQEQAAGRGEIIMYNDPTQIPVKDFGPDDTILVYLGMEWGGGLNLFGGASDDNAIRLGMPAKSPNPVYFLDEDPTDLTVQMRLRKTPEGSLWSQVMNNKRVINTYAQAKSLKQPDFTEVIIGDSHSLSQAVGTERVHRFDGLTLYGALKRGLKTLIAPEEPRLAYSSPEGVYKVKALTFYFGNIDLRFHLMRQPKPDEATRELFRAYYKQLIELKKSGFEISIVIPLPIETEDRKMSKVGMYKGQPFYGTWKERNDLRSLIIELMRKMAEAGGFTLIGHPEYFAPAGIMNQKYMEPSKGVHLSWEYGVYEQLKNGGVRTILHYP